MITYKDFPYTQIPFQDLITRFKEHLRKFSSAISIGEAYFQLIELDYLQRVFTHYATMSEAGNTGNSLDHFFQLEEQLFHKMKPLFENLITERSKALISSLFKNELEILIGEEAIRRAVLSQKIINERVVFYIQEENILSQKYSDMTSQIIIEDVEKNITLPEAYHKMQDNDEEVSRKYYLLIQEAYSSLSNKIDTLYDELVSLRVKIAKETSFYTYTDYCLAKLGRTSYGRKELSEFAHSVENELVPFLERIYVQLLKKKGLDHFYEYNKKKLSIKESFIIEKELLNSFSTIFNKMSPETSLFFKELLESGSFDLDLREGKVSGGYSNNLPLMSIPYIFQTYNRTEDAVKTFAHECGHGLNTFLHRAEPLLMGWEASSDVNEIHAMAMEFLIWPYLDEIIEKKDVNTYKYNHLNNALSFIPYGVAINEFQTIIYDNPDYGIQERLDIWKELEKRFLPWKENIPNTFSAEGRNWQRQIHVIKWPFYYIDYVLAQMVALQFFVLVKEDPEHAFSKYLQFIKLSGKVPFTELLKNIGLNNPFSKDSMQIIINTIEVELVRLKEA